MGKIEETNKETASILKFIDNDIDSLIELIRGKSAHGAKYLNNRKRPVETKKAIEIGAQTHAENN